MPGKAGFPPGVVHERFKASDAFLDNLNGGATKSTTRQRRILHKLDCLAWFFWLDRPHPNSFSPSGTIPTALGNGPARDGASGGMIGSMSPTEASHDLLENAPCRSIPVGSQV
jgi:hypothetical protein